MSAYPGAGRSVGAPSSSTNCVPPPANSRPPWSFVVPLNGACAFEGGGTQFVELEGTPTLRPEPGYALMFSGRNRHRGVPVTAGVRYILAGFLGLEAAGPRPSSAAAAAASTGSSAVTPLQDLSALYGAAELGE